MHFGDVFAPQFTSEPACNSAGLLWDPVGNRCVQELTCKPGWSWDPNGFECVEAVQKAALGVLGWSAIVAGMFVLGSFLMKPKRARRNPQKRRRARKNRTDFDRLKDCRTELQSLRSELRAYESYSRAMR